MKILFLNLSALKFNVTTPDQEPLGGSESAISYLARHLAARKHEVTLLARLPDGFSGMAMGVQHQPLATLKERGFFESEKFEVIVACNAPLACPFLREASPHSLIFLWDHVPPDQPSMKELGNPLVPPSIDAIIYVSEWQKSVTEKKFGITKTSHIIGNGLTPAFENLFASPQELLAVKQNRAAYTTIPYRGLSVLLEVMKGLKDNMALDIFSSMRVYQMDDYEHEELFARAKSDPRITLYGSLSQPKLAEQLKPAAFLTYPCILEETFCISALEAMAAGMKVISTRLGALPTTTMGYADLMPVETQNGHALAEGFRTLLEQNLARFKKAPEAWAEQMFEQIHAINQSCTWKQRTTEWENLFNGRSS